MRFALIPAFVLSASAVAQSSAWTSSQTADAVTDLKTASASVVSNAGGDRLLFKCDGADQHIVTVQFIPKEYLGSVSRPVTVRFDDTSAWEMDDWEYAGRAAFNRKRKIVSYIASRVMGSQRVLVRAWNFDQRPIDAVFQVGGGRKPIEDVFLTCGYKAPQPILSKR